jgi:hypothetical protein
VQDYGVGDGIGSEKHAICHYTFCRGSLCKRDQIYPSLQHPQLRMTTLLHVTLSPSCHPTFLYYVQGGIKVLAEEYRVNNL